MTSSTPRRRARPPRGRRARAGAGGAAPSTTSGSEGALGSKGADGAAALPGLAVGASFSPARCWRARDAETKKRRASPLAWRSVRRQGAQCTTTGRARQGNVHDAGRRQGGSARCGVLGSSPRGRSAVLATGITLLYCQCIQKK